MEKKQNMNAVLCPRHIVVGGHMEFTLSGPFVLLSYCTSVDYKVWRQLCSMDTFLVYTSHDTVQFSLAGLFPLALKSFRNVA
jgi:hypothetical protein